LEKSFIRTIFVDDAVTDEVVIEDAAVFVDDNVEFVDIKTRRKKLNVANVPVQVFAIELAI
jgi:hypothetical protein